MPISMAPPSGPQPLRLTLELGVRVQRPPKRHERHAFQTGLENVFRRRRPTWAIAQSCPAGSGSPVSPHYDASWQEELLSENGRVKDRSLIASRGIPCQGLKGYVIDFLNENILVTGFSRGWFFRMEGVCGKGDRTISRAFMVPGRTELPGT